MISFNAKLGMLAFVIVLAAVSMVRSTKSSLPPLDRDLHSALGRAMGTEVADRLGGPGTIVVVLPRASFEMPLVESQYRAFRKALSGRKGIKIVAEETIHLDRMGPLDGLLTPRIYNDLVTRHSSAGAIVSFVGLGEFSAADLKQVGDATPALCVISLNVTVPWEYLEARLVNVAIVPRLDMDVSTGRGDELSDEARFRRQYEIITASGGGS